MASEGMPEYGEPYFGKPTGPPPIPLWEVEVKPELVTQDGRPLPFADEKLFIRAPKKLRTIESVVVGVYDGNLVRDDDLLTISFPDGTEFQMTFGHFRDAGFKIEFDPPADEPHVVEEKK
jgi:hypothetical protein